MGCGVYYLLIMALNFPSSPTVGQTHDATNGLSYTYDGVKWKSAGTYDASTSGQQYAIDDISSDFNGTTKTFNLHHNSTDISLSSALDVTISIGGVIQEPDDSYTVNPTASTITFSAAPPDGATFFGILKAKLADTNITVSDGTVTNSKLSGDIAVDKLANGTARQLLQSNSGGDDVEWTSNVSIPGTLGVTGVSTFSEDVTFTGASATAFWDKSQNRLEFADNAKTSWGASADLQIYHNGSNSYLDNSTGICYLRGANTYITNADGSENIASFAADGAVDLYWNSSKKFATTTNGISVTGTATLSSGNIFTKVSSTLSSTALAVTSGWHEITADGNALTTLTGGTAGQTLLITVAGSDLVVTDAAIGGGANTIVGGVTLDLSEGDTLLLMFDGTQWRKIAHGDN